MCRTEQKHEINGGFAIAVFSVFPPSRQTIEVVGAGVCRSLYLQAEPRALAPADIVVHAWIRNQEAKKDVGDLAKTRFGQVMAGMQYDMFKGSFGWLSGVQSF